MRFGTPYGFSHFPKALCWECREAAWRRVAHGGKSVRLLKQTRDNGARGHPEPAGGGARSTGWGAWAAPQIHLLRDTPGQLTSCDFIAVPVTQDDTVHTALSRFS